MQRSLLLGLLAGVGGCAVTGPHPGPEPEVVRLPDGCTLAPDFNFSHCCVEHDLAYWRGGSCENRRESDRQLGQCIADAGHPVLGKVYRFVVYFTASPHLNTNWRWGFGWKWPHGYTETCMINPR